MLMFYLSAVEEETDRLNFEQIYRKYSDGIYKRVYKILQNKQDTEDVVQETWIKVVENIELFREKDEKMICAYIMRIARNLSISLLRVKGRANKMLCEVESERLADDGEFFNICDDHGEEEIIECIRSLDMIYSDVLVYYYLYHYSVKEIAKLLSLKEATARKRVERGRALLIELLIRRGYHHD